MESGTVWIALASGLFGALTSAVLSYLVRVKARAREVRERKRSIAYVHFLQLTEFVAIDFFLKQMFGKMLEDQEAGDPDLEWSHRIAAFIENQALEVSEEQLHDIYETAEPLAISVGKNLDIFELSLMERADLDRDTLYHFQRFQAAAAGLRTAMGMIGKGVESGDRKLLSAATVHAVYESYRRFSDTAGILRAAFAKSAVLPDEESLQCLVRSYEQIKKDTFDSLSNQSKLKRAAEMVRETPDANNAINPDA